jgi:hypothetical protein
MLKIKPVSEEDAKGEVKQIYQSIRTILNLVSVPLVFRYMASFPYYLSYIWEQTIKNLDNSFYAKSADDIKIFSITAINGIYKPSSLACLFLKEIGESPQKIALEEFSAKNLIVAAKLYLLALSIRESIKGKFLGIKLFGERITEKEQKIFNDFTDGFGKENNLTMDIKPSKNEIVSVTKHIQASNTGHRNIARSFTEDFFNLINHEMRLLTRKEEYLTRRVELERFSLNKLYLLPFPLDSSLSSIISRSADNSQFPELIYLVSELFPTQAPYKLMSSAVMKKLLEN